MITKVFCSGFKLFQQIPEVYDQSLDNYCSLLNDLPNIKLVTFSWSACYILLGEFSNEINEMSIINISLNMFGIKFEICDI